MNTKPSPYLPDWALRYFEQHRDRFDDPEEMPHRRDAFYRLFCADANDLDMRRMWERAARFITAPTMCCFIPGPHASENHVTDTDMEARDFLSRLIYATDHAVPGDPIADKQIPASKPEARLREADRRLARKLARLLREWQIVTPFDSVAGMSLDKGNMQHIGDVIDRLVTAYDFELEPPDLSEIHKRHGIEHTANSKRGWRARRRASDVVRHKIIRDALRLSEIGRPQDSGDLAHLAYKLRDFPDMNNDRTDGADLRVQKTGWPDWLRVASSHPLFCGDRDGTLRHDDWLTLVRVLYEEVDYRRIGQVLNNGQ